jgi:heme exporter protein CcmB
MILNIIISIYKLFIQYSIINFKENTAVLNFSFYILILLLFSISINVNLFNILTFNLIYLTFLLTFIFSIQHIFQKDYEDDTLILLYLIILPIVFLMALKILIHWVNYGLSLILISPLIFSIFNLLNNLSNNILILIYASLYLSIWSAFCGTLILELKQKFLIIILIIIPIFLPVHIFTNNINNINFLQICLSLNLLFIYGIINLFISANILKVILNNIK